MSQIYDLIAERYAIKDAEIKRLQDELEIYKTATEATVMESKPLARIGKEVVEINIANGWDVVTPEIFAKAIDSTHPEHTASVRRLATVLCLIHSEVSEALEATRKCDAANFAEELADVLIRVLDCAFGLGIDLDAEVAAKLETNRGRGLRHGGKAI